MKVACTVALAVPGVAAACGAAACGLVNIPAMQVGKFSGSL